MRSGCAIAVLITLLLSACAGESEAVTRPARHPDDLPIVLAHGLSGFRRLSGVDYFFQVPEHLRGHGLRVFVTHVPPWAPVETRAQHLGQQIDAALRRSGAPRVHIIAHSMGGLDSRYAISRLGYGNRVATLTTIGTPHRGSVLADGYDRINMPITHPVQDLTADFWIWTLGGIKVHSDTAGAVRSLSESNAMQFNLQTPDDPRVRYYSFAGRTLGHDGRGECDDGVFPNPDEVDYAPPELLTSAVVLSGNPLQPSVNDGLVSVRSARWGVFMGCLPADHLEQIGHPVRVASLPGRWSHKDFYLRWALELTTGTARTYVPRSSTSVPMAR